MFHLLTLKTLLNYWYKLGFKIKKKERLVVHVAAFSTE